MTSSHFCFVPKMSHQPNRRNNHTYPALGHVEKRHWQSLGDNSLKTHVAARQKALSGEWQIGDVGVRSGRCSSARWREQCVCVCEDTEPTWTVCQASWRQEIRIVGRRKWCAFLDNDQQTDVKRPLAARSRTQGSAGHSDVQLTSNQRYKLRGWSRAEVGK